MTAQLSKHVRMRVREAERFAVSVMSQLRRDDGPTVDALICNLSEKGFMINSSDYFPEGSLVSLFVPGIGPCKAIVVWSFCGDTGASFLDPIDMDLYWAATRRRREADNDIAEMVSTSRHLGEYLARGAERINAQGHFGLRAESFQTVEAEIRDISSLGLKGGCSEPLQIGSIIEVDIPGLGPVEAEVKWQLGSDFGAMFLEAVDLRRCEWAAVRAKFS
jgi:hypothetical protein